MGLFSEDLACVAEFGSHLGMAPPIPPKSAVVCLPFASASLMDGALGIGENHTEPNGRELVKLLLKRGAAGLGPRVTNLFLELSSYGGTRDKILAEAAEKMQAGDRDRARFLAEALAVEESRSYASPRLGALLYLGLKHGATVHLADPMIGSGFSVTAVKRRNAATADYFKRVLSTDRGDSPASVGSLLLFGADHFKLGGGIQKLLPGLAWIFTCGRPGKPD